MQLLIQSKIDKIGFVNFPYQNLKPSTPNISQINESPISEITHYEICPQNGIIRNNFGNICCIWKVMKRKFCINLKYKVIDYLRYNLYSVYYLESFALSRFSIYNLLSKQRS